ncbi:MAG TPA: carboxypeptidase regulatory-like domain-containing protein [Streptosporangiaceae bacterium]|nr:carboxypeptidase regulatory-like domain-containing protein [Streptosporangiaceae bacterium]
MALRNQHGSIVGRVLGANGAPEANVCVVASSPLAIRRAYSRPDGRFVIAGLPRGAYRVEYRGCSPIAKFTAQWYGGLTRGSATPVLVTGSAAPVRLAPVKLSMISPRFMHSATAKRTLGSAQRAAKLIRRIAFGPRVQAPARVTSAGRITGRVTTRSGHPLARVCVFATPVRHPAAFVALASTGAKGGYKLRLKPGRYFVDFLPLCRAKGNFAPQLWKHAGALAKATAVRVKAHETVAHVNAVLGVGAVITGRVKTLKHPHPSLGGLCVEASGTRGQRLFFGFTTTRADGTFRLRSLATGRYKISVTPCGPSSPYLPTQLAEPVRVTNGKVTSGITAFVKLGGTITGTVKDADGNKLAGICVEAGSRRSFASASTSASGTYRLVGLARGTYEVDFSTGCGNTRPFAPLVYPNPVVVRQGKVTPHIDAVLQLDGTLTGTVTDSHGNPLGGICVAAESSSLDFAFAVTKADGTYKAKRVPPGVYHVEFIPGGAFSDCGNKGNFLPVDDSATVTSGVTTTLNASLPTGGIIKGVLSDPHGHPAAGICVFSTAEFGGQAVTKPDGSYRLRQLFTGDYFVGYDGGCGNKGSVAPLAYKSDPTFFAPTTISVTAGQVTSGIDARLRPGGTITGRVTDRAGKPVSGVCMIAQAFTGAGGGFNGFGVFQVERGGRFKATNLAPGQYAVVFFGLTTKHSFCGPSPYADQQFLRQGGGAPLDLVTVQGGKITSGVNARLTLAGSISGTVLNKAGHPVPNICVIATNPRSGAANEEFTGTHGKYKITQLTPGRYQVEFSSCGGDFAFFGITGLNYANQWYKRHSTQAAADTVVVRPAATTANINAALTKGATVTGQVVFKPTQRPISFVCVYAYTPDLKTLSFGLTDRRGRYLVDGLSTGRYIVEFDPCSGESALAGQIRAGRLQLVAGHAVNNVNEQLGLGGSVSGVTSASLAGGHVRPEPGTCVEALPLSPTAPAALSFAFDGGSYQVTHLAAGKYEILAGDPSCSSNAPALSAKLSAPVQVTSGKDTGGANLTLRVTGAITGAVRGPSGKPLAGICVEAVPQQPGIGIPTAISRAAGGAYRIGDLQPGAYKVKFTDGCGADGFATRWYKNARTKFGGRFVHVSAASVTSGINQTLPKG